MATTQLSDVFVPEIFASYQVEDSIVSTAFVKSGIMVTNGQMNELASGPGSLTDMPFWLPLDSSTEPSYSNDVYTDIATPAKVSAAEQIARKAFLAEGFQAADLVAALAGSDPLRFVATHIDQYWVEQLQKRLISTTIGIYNDNKADNASDMIYDISLATGTVTSANQFSANAFVGGVMTLGDRLNKIGAIAMHSVIYASLVKQQLIQFIPNALGQLVIPTYMGKVLLVDDGMPTVGTGTGANLQYLCALYGQGAFGYGNGTVKVPFEYYRSPDRGNGGGIETLWSRRTWVIHPFGYKWLGATITGPGISPTWADLKLATNWQRVVARKIIPMAFLVVNA
jgi:hypothetical protein